MTLAWLKSYEEAYGDVPDDQLHLLNTPERAVQHQQNSSPYEPQRRVSKDGYVWEDDGLSPAPRSRLTLPHFLRYGRADKRGRKWDHLRSASPVVVSNFQPIWPKASVSWKEFLKSSAQPRLPDDKSRIVDKETMEKMYPGWDRDMEAQLQDADSKYAKKRRTRTLSKRLLISIMRHPLSPFFFRMGVMVTSIVALGIAAKIFALESGISDVGAERNQSIVAVAVDCVAIPYIAYMIWDEYTGKPLGLRSAMNKISLILLDLFFIIFKSASTALAFESFIYHTVRQTVLVHSSMALAAFMLLGLISWTINFAINIFRTVKKLGGVGDDDSGI